LVHFSFEIHETNRKLAYGRLRQKFTAEFKKRGIRQETPLESFSYQTGWARGTISLSKENTQITITGTVERQMSIVFMVILAVVVGYFTYGILGAFMMPGLILLVSLPVDAFIGGKHRKNIGPRLCKALRGTKFQQQD
jgi:hypothetical protein